MLDWQPKAPYTAEQLLEILRILRDPENGCPWDKVQTHASIRKNFLEETCEALEAIDADDPVLMQEELGDVLMQVAFCIFIYYGVMLSIKSWKRSFQTLPISYSFVTIALPVMSTLMTLTNILKIIDKVKNFKKNVALAMEKGKA